MDGIRILGLPQARRWRRPLNWARALRLALRCRADVYHIHDPELLLIAPLIRLLSRRPVIYDAHELVGSNVQLKEWLPRRLRVTLGRIAGRAEHALKRAVNAVVYVSPPQHALYADLQPTVPVVLVANYPVRDDYVDAVREQRTAAAVFIGGLTEARGIPVLLRAFKRVIGAILDAQLWLVGPATPPSYEEWIRAWAGSHGVVDAVHLFGRIPFASVKPLLVRSAVGIVTYLPVGDYPESLPTKLFEYMASGLPCVCSNIPLWADIVERAGCGLIVDPSDASAVAEEIIYLLEHPHEAAEMGRRGREAFLAHYTWEQEGAKLVAVYEQLDLPPSTLPLTGAEIERVCSAIGRMLG
ncbi:MAG: glycosyltransferase family 4 protein [Armatimonadota bacterium]|nr:MAG: glycosyltransferase family 4 protein [Armatimonadota bacterium]